jgi:uncharacterized damage-inducible protein DinB
MKSETYLKLIRYKQWADRGLFKVVAETFDRLSRDDAAILVRILDHIHVVDRIFQHHLRGLPHAFHAPRSADAPNVRALMASASVVDDWYVGYVRSLSEVDFDEPVELVFTNGTPARMTRGEILLHVGLHGTYHRGNAGVVLQKNGIKPNDDRVTDFLEEAA